MRCKLTIVLCSTALLLTGCQTTTWSEYSAAGVEYREPVEFNNQRYEVAFQYSNSLSGFDVKVTRPGQPLSGGSSDRDTSIQVGTSAVSHFACAQGQRAQIVDGTAAYTSSSIWSLQAKCRS